MHLIELAVALLIFRVYQMHVGRSRMCHASSITRTVWTSVFGLLAALSYNRTAQSYICDCYNDSLRRIFLSSKTRIRWTSIRASTEKTKDFGREWRWGKTPRHNVLMISFALFFDTTPAPNVPLSFRFIFRQKVCLVSLFLSIFPHKDNLKIHHSPVHRWWCRALSGFSSVISFWDAFLMISNLSFHGVWWQAVPRGLT